MSQKTSERVPVPGIATDALTSTGAIRIFTDLGVSGSKASRPGLDAALEFICEDDVLMV